MVWVEDFEAVIRQTIEVGIEVLRYVSAQSGYNLTRKSFGVTAASRIREKQLSMSQSMVNS